MAEAPPYTGAEAVTTGPALTPASVHHYCRRRFLAAPGRHRRHGALPEDGARAAGAGGRNRLLLELLLELTSAVALNQPRRRRHPTLHVSPS